MSASKTFGGKCPYCLPDGGAIFDYHGQGQKKCRNCGTILPLREVKPTRKPTKSQQRVVDRIVSLFGGTPEITMIGRNVFINLANHERNMWFGDALFGTIGPRGAFEIKLQKVGGSKVLTDDIDLSVYLRDPKLQPTLNS